jgi:drug/metabolite transporter (DMT)-like permease
MKPRTPMNNGFFPGWNAKIMVAILPEPSGDIQHLWHNPNMTRAPSRNTAILLAVLVTFLWSTSWVLIKVGLRSSLPPITFAGLRYWLAFLVLVPFVLLNPERRGEMQALGRADWLKFSLLGVLTYTITQAAQYISLAYLPAAMLSLLLNLTSLFVAFAGIHALGEKPGRLQWMGILLTVLGTGVYFLPVVFTRGQWLGIVAALICLTGNVAASLLGRRVNRTRAHSPLLVTAISMGAGSTLMLATGLLTQGVGRLTAQDWAIIAWLAVVNTALTFTIWNLSLRVLTAFESSIINNLMMPQIAILAYVFLKEALSGKEIFGLILVGMGVWIVQMRRTRGVPGSELSSERTV